MEVIIRPDDSFKYYSDLFGIPLDLIEASNPLLDADRLMNSQTVKIPGYTVRSYFITAGASMQDIAMQQNIPADMLQLVNPSIDPQSMQSDYLVIPERVQDLILTDFDSYTFDKLTGDIDQLLTVYPFINQQTIGQSVMGEDLIELQIGTGDKQLHLNGSFHANEWITTSVIMRFINEYARAVTNGMPIKGVSVRSCFSETNLSVVPMVNPDGVNLVLKGASAAGDYHDRVLALNHYDPDFSKWKANIAGIDLNKQYPALWEADAAQKPDSPKPRDYPGPYPISEPETTAMADLTRKRDFQRMNVLHTQGEVIFWDFEGLAPSASESIVHEYARLSGYQPVRYAGSYAGFKDWFIQEFGRPGFTIELGSGVNPLPFSQFDDIFQKTLGTMLALLYW